MLFLGMKKSSFSSEVYTPNFFQMTVMYLVLIITYETCTWFVDGSLPLK